MSKIKKQNRRAFTLTELLIVVIVIGVLSAVTLPKFNRVIENRKVTEAEEMMSAVRTEQERRCTLDQNYTTNFSALSDVIASANTKNYTYSLQSQGISARSNGGDYTLKILSYEDGSYCCTGDGCKKLNKNYPDCDTLRFPTSNCAGTEGETTPPGTEPTPVEPEEPECVNGQVTGNQVCNGCGTQTTKACVGGKWVNSLGACSKTAEECAPKPECSGTQPADAIKQCECGTVKASYKCDASTNYQWVQEEFPECPAKPDDITETCSDGKTERTKAYTCVNNVWTEGDWDKECPEEAPCEPPNGKQTAYKDCSCGGNAPATWSTEKCDYVFNGYGNSTVEITCDYDEEELGCSTSYDSPNEFCDYIYHYYCDANADVSFSIPIYYKTYKGSSWNKWNVMELGRGSSHRTDDWGYTSGWDDPLFSMPNSYALSNRGEKTITKTCGDCTYTISM